MKPEIATKISALAIALMLVTAGAIGILIFTGYDAILVSRELGSLGDEARLESVQLVSGIEALRQDVLFLSATPPIQGLIRARAAGGVDPLDGSTEAEWRHRLADIFTQFLEAKTTYLEARYISAAGEGRELVRVSRSDDGLATAADEELQSREDTPYFRETIRLPAGEVYLSDITLNRESGRVVEPYIPVLRAAVPVYAPEGDVFGIVAINMDFAPALERTEQEQHLHYVTNDAGDFLAYPDPAMTFGFDLGERHRVQETYPELAPLFEPGKGEREIAFRSEVNGRSEAVHFLKVAFDPAHPDRFLGLALVASYEDVVAASTAVRNRSVTLTLLLIAVGTALAFFFSRVLTRPLSQITQAARGFAGGALDAPLPVNANDEIGVLARAFRAMIQQVDERTGALRESEDRYRTLFELAGDAILMVLPPEGDILDANQAAVRLLGYSKEELRKLNGGQIIAPEVAEETNREWIAQVEDKGYFLLETIWVRKDGSRFPVSVSGKPLEVGGEARFQLIVRDIRERVRATEEKRQIQERTQRQHETLIRLSTHPAVAEGRLEEALSTISGAAAEVLDVERVNVWRLSPDGHELRSLESFERSRGWHSAGYILRSEEYPRYFAALDTDRAVRVTHTKTDPRTAELAAEYWEPLGINSTIEAPVRLHGQLVGVVCHEHVGPPRAWTPDEVAFASTVADLVTQTFLNAEIRSRAAQQQALNAIIASAVAASHLPDLLETALEQTLQALELQVGAIWVADQRAARGIAPEHVRGIVRAAQEERLELHGPAVVADWSTEGEQFSSALAGVLDQSGIRASVTVPIRAGEQRIGGLSVTAPEPRSWLPEEIALVEAVGAQLGAAAERLRLFQETDIHNKLMARLTTISESLNRPFSPSEVVTAIGQGALTLTKVDRGAVYLRQPDDRVTCPWSQGLSPAYLEQVVARPQDLPGGRLLQQTEPILISDVARLPEDAAVRNLAEAERYRAVALWPLVYEGRTAAAVGCYHDEPHTWSAGEQEVMAAFARQASVALENARLFESAQRRLEHLQALRNIDLAITASLDLRVTLNVFLDEVTSQMGVDAAAVLLLNPHTQTLEHAANRGFHSNAIERSRLRLGEGHAGRAALERAIVNIPNLPDTGAAFLRAHLLAGEAFIAYYAVPLIAKGQVKGVLEIFHRAPLGAGAEWLAFLEALAAQAAIAVDNASLFDDLQRSNVDLTLAYDATLEGWSRAMDLRDKETEGHTQRVTEMTLRLARAIGMSDEELVHVRRGALLHDMGKMGVPDSILLKPGPLTEEEWEVMRQHPVFAYEMLSPIAYLRPALDIPYCHHEKWDGSGYPRGLKGEQIPLAARVFAVADVWDALRSDRPYREAWEEKKVMAYIREQAGTHFDPQVLEAFLSIVRES